MPLSLYCFQTRLLLLLVVMCVVLSVVFRNYMNDSFRTNVFVRFNPETIASACIYLAARQLQVTNVCTLYLTLASFRSTVGCCFPVLSSSISKEL